jgi:hypothetical protein
LCELEKYLYSLHAAEIADDKYKEMIDSLSNSTTVLENQS